MDDLSDDEVLDTHPYKDSFEISREKADMLYEKAGELVAEDAEQITIEKYQHLLCDKVHCIIQEVLQENNVGFELQEFQMLTLHCLGNLKNVVLVCGTGSGKMICSYLGTLVLRKVFGKENGVGIGNMPLSALMEEKLRKPVIKTGLISMKGDLKVSSEDSADAALSAPIEEFKSGAVGFIIGHAESWMTNTAREITETLRKEEQIIFTFVDEFQMNLSSFWGKDFRFGFF